MIYQHRIEPLAFLETAFRGIQINWPKFEKEALEMYKAFERMDYLLFTEEKKNVSPNIGTAYLHFNPRIWTQILAVS